MPAHCWNGLVAQVSSLAALPVVCMSDIENVDADDATVLSLPWRWRSTPTVAHAPTTARAAAAVSGDRRRSRAAPMSPYAAASLSSANPSMATSRATLTSVRGRRRPAQHDDESGRGAPDRPLASAHRLSPFQRWLGNGRSRAAVCYSALSSLSRLQGALLRGCTRWPAMPATWGPWWGGCR